MSLAQRVALAATRVLEKRTSRRGFLVRAGVVGTALAVDPFGYVLKPGTAYAAVCGPGSTCGTGWTVFCATVNNGVNACPPGSIAAGWWKADGASLCGGKARYIIDCNATCSRCTSPGARPGICAQSCWSCSCTCGPTSSCDQRKVCCNGFRYGQCNTQVRQVGGVHCRVVSCRPPWEFENCSTAPATDNRTRDHNSDALPTAWTAITARHLALGENASRLGPTVYGEIAVAGGRAQRYVGGRISQHPATGLRETYGDIAVRYAEVGAEAGPLGFPTGLESTVPGGLAQSFQRGRISWSEATGASEVIGPRLEAYRRAGLEAGQLGFPVGGDRTTPGNTGRFVRFQRGRISWSEATGARWMGAAIAERYVQLGAENGLLGFPLTDEQMGRQRSFVSLPDRRDRTVLFQNGRLTFSGRLGVVIAEPASLDDPRPLPR